MRLSYSFINKGGGAYSIPGGANARDNYPLSTAVAMKYESVPALAEAGKSEAGKTIPGFTGIVVLVSIMTVEF